MANQENEVIFDHFRYVWNLLNDLFTDDLSASLTDTEKFLFYKPGRKLDLRAPIGQPFKEGSAVYRAIHEKKRIVTKIDKAMFGLPYIAVAIPLYNAQGQVIGAASIQQAVDRQEALKEIADVLSTNMMKISSNVQEISAQSEEISAVSRTMVQSSHDSIKRVKETDDVIHIIKNISGQTNLLGLNAAIEAARVGEMGRGFGVVAEEIRKLAQGSAESIAKINEIVAAIQTDSSSMGKQLQDVEKVISQIAVAITETAEAIEQASTMAHKLDVIALELSGEKE